MRIEQLVSPSSLKKLRFFVQNLDRWRRITNLISDDDFQVVWQRHVLDSISLQRQFPEKRRWLDFGSGAGFPGIVLGILLAEERCAQIHCVESDGRKCAFLRSVVQRLKIPVKIHNARAEAVSVGDTGPVDVVTARAFSSVRKILCLCEEYMRDGAIVILPRGKTSAREVEALDPNRYSSVVRANPMAGGGIFLQIQLRTGRRQ
jgi:16S rRNA (guanine527-N7)-methyltransferase